MTRDEFFEKLATGAKWDIGVSINRTNPLPIDSTSVFKTYTEALEYAKTNPTAHLGQQVVVLDENVDDSKLYLIIRTGKLSVEPLPEYLKEIGGVKIIVDDTLSETSENPVQNKVIYSEFEKKQNKLTAGKGIAIDERTGTITATGEVIGTIPVATPETVGGIKLSEDFDISPDGVLTIYKPIAIESFVNNKNTVALGTTITEIKLDWVLNKVPTTLMLDEEVLDTSLTTITKQVNITNDTTYTLKATDSRGASVSVPTIIDFKNYIYWGVAGETINEEGVKNLAHKELSDDKVKDISVTLEQGQYLYYILPERIELEQGEAIFSVDGFEGGFDEFIFDSPEPQLEKKVVQITNEVGHTENYLIYRSANDNLGTIKVEVR